MQKAKRFLAKIMVVLCLSFVVTPEVTIISNTSITAQAATSYSKSTIKHVQEKLNAKGYKCGNPDGIAGKDTKAAIKKYQKDHGLSVTGTVNKTLLKSLNIKGTKVAYSDKKETIVYVTESGTKYHRSGCSYLWHSSIPMKKSEAQKYYSPCSVCNP